MHFETIIELANQLKSSSIFVFTFQSVKALALAFLLLKVINEFIKTWDKGHVFQLGNYVSYFGTALLILSSSWIIDLGEEQLLIIDAKLNSLGSDKDIFTIVFDEAYNQEVDAKANAGDFSFVLSDIIDVIYTVVIGFISALIASFFKIADMVITMGVLIVRLFIVEFLKLIFPIALLFSVFDNTKNFFYSWVKRYVGVVVLGVAYIGVFYIINLLIVIMVNNTMTMDWWDMGEKATNALITICVVYPLKFKLLRDVTSYVFGMFN